MKSIIIQLLTDFININPSDYRPYGLGQMMVSGDIVTICINQVEPDDEWGEEGYTEWANFLFSEQLVRFFEEQGFHLVA